MHTAAEPKKREPVNKASLSACRQCDFQWLPERNARRFFHSGVCRPPKASYLQSALSRFAANPGTNVSPQNI